LHNNKEIKLAVMKYLYLVLMSLTIFSFTTEEKECRNFNFGASLQTVKSKETASLLKEEILLHNLKSLTFVEHQVEASYLYTYTFHSDHLTGLQIKNISVNGDNSYLNAYANYQRAKNKYNLNCEVKLKETVSDKGLVSFQINHNKSKIYAQIEKEDQDFYFVETILKK
jgi:hypothetical protein